MSFGHLPSAADLTHRVAIEELLYSHCRGVDRADSDTLKAAYWPEAEVAYGGYNGPAHPFCEILPESIRRYRATHHQVSTILIPRQGDNAVVESYVTAYHHQPAGEPTEMTYFGRYVDHMQLRHETWKILYRHVVMDWNQQLTESADFVSPSMAGLAKSGRKPDDPLYALQQKLFGTQKNPEGEET